MTNALEAKGNKGARIERFPRLDLRRVRCVDFTIAGSWPAGEATWSVVDGLLSESQLDRDTTIFQATIVTRYRENDTSVGSVIATALIGAPSPVDGSDSPLSFAVLYRPTDLRSTTRPRGTTSQGIFFERAKVLGSVESAESRARFRIAVNDPNQLWFPLPTVVASEDGAHGAFEIRGVRGIRHSRTSEDPAYSFSIERDASMDALISVTTPVQGTLDASLIRHAYNDALVNFSALVRS